MKPPYICKFCGQPSWVDPIDQSLPPAYCHEEDHGTKEDYIAALFEEVPMEEE